MQFKLKLKGEIMSAPEQQRIRRTELQILDSRRDELAQGLITYKQFLEVIPVNKQEQFKRNFLELCTQDYLLSIIDTKELIRFATNVSKTGLDIAPSSKEVYIIPFDTLVNKVKTMLPQAIIPLNGMQQLCYQKGFFLQVDAVWKFDDNSCESELKLTRLQQSQLKTANAEWVESHFIGFDVILTDLKNELPIQIKFVDLNYVKEATKTIKDERWKLQTWRHKAVRRAYGDFMIPRDRKIEAFEEVEALNDAVLAASDTEATILLTQDIEQAVKQLGLDIAKSNSTAVVTGATFGKDAMLKKLGFVYISGKWQMNYEEQQSLPSKPPKSQHPAMVLMQFLADNGLSTEEQKQFVGEYLKLTKTDTQQISEWLSKTDSLLNEISSWRNKVGQNSLFQE